MFKKIFNWPRYKNLFLLYRKAFGAYKKQMALLAGLSLTNAALEGIGVNALIPILSYFIKDGSGEYNGLVQYMQKMFAFLHIDFSLKQLLIFVILLFIAKAIVIIITNYVRARITTAYEADTRSKLLRSTLKADWPYLSNQKIGYLENVIKINCTKSSLLFQEISVVLITFTGLCVYVIIALNISLYITLVTLALVGIILLLFMPILKLTKIASQAMMQTYLDSAHHINQSINGIKTIKTTLTEKIIADKGDELFQNIKKLSVKTFLLRTVPNSMIQPMGLIFICVLLGLAYKSQSFDLTVLIPIIYLTERMFEYGKRLQSNLSNMIEMTPYLRNVLEHQEKAKQAQEDKNANKPFSFANKLELVDLSFQYPGKKDMVLKNINCAIKKGELIGIVGPSGGGKTTVVDLILRLLQPTDGQILLDGQNIDKINLKQWRHKVGYVSQDIFLLNDTIANNIKFFNDDITDEEIEESAKNANIYDFVQTLPQKFNSEIGEKGVLLSTGQRQRIVIARTLIRKPEILILDEATSALDSESEIKIQAVIENLKGKITVIAIAHRLSTVLNSDKILVLNNGIIEEQGNAQNLLKDKESYFYRVYNIRNK